MAITLKPVSRDEIPEVSTRTSSESAQLFESFLTGEAEVVQVELDDPTKVISTRSSLGNYIERHQRRFLSDFGSGIRLFTRNSKLYMEKVDAETVAKMDAESAERKARRAAKAEANGDTEASADTPEDATAEVG